MYVLRCVENYCRLLSFGLELERPANARWYTWCAYTHRNDVTYTTLRISIALSHKCGTSCEIKVAFLQEKRTVILFYSMRYILFLFFFSRIVRLYIA